MKKKQILSNKAVIYCRVSTEEQVEGGSLAHQEKTCRSFADKHNLSVQEIFVEEGESGRLSNRTQLNKLLDYVLTKKNDISYVISLKVDRLMRNNEAYIAYNHIFTKHNIKLLYVMENNDDTSSGFLARGFAGLIADHESRVNSERTKAGNKEAFLSGRWIKQIAGYSFKLNAFGKKVIAPNQDARHIKKAFELMSKGIYSQREIIRELQKDGYKVASQSLSKILRNSVYCGILPDYQNVNGSKPVKGIHEPLISEDLFRKVQHIIEGKKPSIISRKRDNPLYPLKGFFMCPKCGKKLTASKTDGHGGRYHYYHCNGGKGCHHYDGKVVEPIYSDYLKTLHLPEELAKAFEQMVIDELSSKTIDIQKQHSKIRKEIEALENKKNNLISLLAEKTVEERDITPVLNKVKEEIFEKQSYLSDEDSGPNIKDCWEYSKNFLNNCSDIWEKGDLYVKRKVQGLITPNGFHFLNKLIQPIKNPYFIDIFVSKIGKYPNMGG